MTQTQQPVSPATPPCGGHLVTVDGRTLPLRGTRLVARTVGGIATVKVVQTFANPLTTPVNALYLFPLNKDAAVYEMIMEVGDETVRAQIEPLTGLKAS